MKTTTIVLPISRPEHLHKLFVSLEELQCDTDRTSLLAYVDGGDELYLTARNYVEQSRFKERLCVKAQLPGERRAFSINARRRRIAAIHNAVRELLEPCDYVFLIEDDGLLPADALSRLLMGYVAYPHAGFIEGMELGRWGIPHVGAWRADDVYEPRQLVSAMPRNGVEQIDAGGFYACLTPYEHYAKHEFAPYTGMAFGPDVEYGIWLRQQGYRNYIDWSVNVLHYQQDGKLLNMRTTPPVQVTLDREAGAWTRTVVGA